MKALALQLPESLMHESDQIAKHLNLSRSAFIRLAIEDEIAKVKRQVQEDAMLKAFKAMARSPDYKKESLILEEALDSSILEEEEKWWSNP